MAGPSDPWRHHYVPQFYISNWAGTDGLVWQRSRTPRGTFEDKRVPTRSTGFAKNLYTLRSKLPFARQSDPAEIETKLMQKLDELSAGALRKLVTDGVGALDQGEREDWALFMNGLIERAARRLRRHDQRAVEVASSLAAEHLARMPVERRDRMASLLDPALQAAWANNIVRSHMVDQIRDPKVIEYFASMEWHVLTLPSDSNLAGADAELITTDAPLLVNCGRDDGPIHTLSIALNPQRLFFAHKEAEPLTEEFAGALWLTHGVSLLMQPCSFVYSARELSDGKVVRLRTASEIYMSGTATPTGDGSDEGGRTR